MDIGILFFLSIVGWALFLMLLLPRLKAGHALMSALCAMLFVAYLGVIVVQVMQPTAYVLIVGGLGMLVVGLVAAILNKRELRKRLCSVSLLCYLVFALLCALSLKDCIIQDHDSLSYWARIAKELFTYERFPIHGDRNMYHLDYFPMLGSLQYCVVRVFGWQDAYIYYVTCACILVSISAVVDLMRSRFWAVVAAVLLRCGFTAFGSQFVATRADGPISAIAAAAVLCFFMRDEDDTAAWLPTFCAAVVLTGFKIYSGLMLSLLLGFCMLLSVRRVKRRNKAAGRTLLVLGIVALALTLVVQFSWSALYHYNERLAIYEGAVATARYTGVPFNGEKPVFLLRDLFTGNPRTESLLKTLNAEAFQNVKTLIRRTLTDYLGSRLTRIWPFMLLVAALAVFATRDERRRIVNTVGALLVAAGLYTLGLFGSYFVQAETYGAAITYIRTVTTPLLWVALFIMLRAVETVTANVALLRTQSSVEPFFARDDRKGKRLAAVGACAVLALMVGGMVRLSPSCFAIWRSEANAELTSYAAMANDYYTNRIANQLTADDANERALLIDCSQAASQIGSVSGKTHAYQYFGVPVRVFVRQYSYGDYAQLEGITKKGLINTINSERCDLLLLNIDDELYWEKIRDELGLDGGKSVAAYDIIREDGELSFRCRSEE